MREEKRKKEKKKEKKREAGPGGGGGGGMKGDFPEAAGENILCSSLLSNSLGIFNTVSHIRVTKKPHTKLDKAWQLKDRHGKRQKNGRKERNTHTHTHTHTQTKKHPSKLQTQKGRELTICRRVSFSSSHWWSTSSESPRGRHPFKFSSPRT